MRIAGWLTKMCAGAGMLALLALGSCRGSSSMVDACVGSNTCFVFEGVVQGEDGKPVVNASVTYHGDAPATPPEADHRRRGPLSGQGRGAAALRPGGGRPPVLASSRAIWAELDINVPVVLVLRPLDLVKTVTLAPAGGDAVTVTVTRKDDEAQTTLSIPGGAMVDAKGQPFAGNANINLTFWSASSSLASIPGPLLAVPDDANAP